ncbi:rare lipoprotein A [Thiothrix caldifontis]|uniref:Endolytic peptidoglycan transglycosylase RlpA n=1 Tax=Thiothrix caldifontis TaxID=525918 RepID=A0A1H3W6J3_9GAMM|nr:septal ring lytic transglycosylase RlpA family protein [Thiothrix caldifontis]SDZ82451.1 rare lipoprotein A [Thiothrix caldifontis]
MKILKQSLWTGWTRRIGVSITALALATTFSLPTAAIAKEKKAASKVSAQQKSSKKVSHNKASKKVHKTKIRAKHTKAAKSRVLSKQRSKSTNESQQWVWNPSQEPKQAYYTIPTSVAGTAANPPSQPAFLPPEAPISAKPVAESGKAHQVGTASFYSDKFNGRKTASGERFDQNDLTCAHGSLPFGCRIRVTNLRNNKAVEVKVNDRGGFHKHGRVIDLSKAAAKEIGMVATGTAKVKVEVLE